MKSVLVYLLMWIIALAGFIGYKSLEYKDNRGKCNEILIKDYESKTKEFKVGLSKLPFEVLYYYNYGRLEYCLHNGKLDG